MLAEQLRQEGQLDEATSIHIEATGEFKQLGLSCT